ncbi:hypothetical protein GIB67_039929 [Kingdonia uniflora]|uniref:Uncharacterized protein n=1 Tax=Kingdonia uniflora TaxID=39325 RepID=A0A7J7P482_9MAGN|nr:hypothetical protein GIB67_039929 [Kingdonia uniflora]
MVLRGQGDSPVRICDPCKKLEEAARFEMRHGHKSKPGRGGSKLILKSEDDVLNEILGTDGRWPSLSRGESTTSDLQRAASNASCSSFNEEYLKEDGIVHILESPSIDQRKRSLNEVDPSSPEDLRQQALEEKKKYKVLKGEGHPEEALRAFKRGKELEREAKALEVALRKSQKKTFSSISSSSIHLVNDSSKELGKKDRISPQKDDLASELRELGWSDADLHDSDAKPTKMTLDGELSSLISEEIQKKPGVVRVTRSIDKTQVLEIKKKALMLKREGKLAEAKEELKKAKILEKQLEEQEFLAEANDSDDELSALIRSMDDDKQDNTGYKFDQIDGITDGLDLVGNFEVTDDDLDDPEMATALKSLGWADEDLEHPVVLLDVKVLQHEVLSLKKEAVIQKRVGNVAEAMSLLKKAKLIERDIEGLQSQEKSSIELNPTAKNGLPLQTLEKLLPKSKFVIQKELLSLKKKALALRREGRLDESEEELRKGKILEHQLEEMESASKVTTPKVNALPNNLEIVDEDDGDDLTEKDMNDPALLALLQNLGWKDEQVEPDSLHSRSSKHVSDSFEPVTSSVVEAPPSRNSVATKRKGKAEIQRELLGMKRNALTLRRQGEVEEAEEVLGKAKVLEEQIEELEESKKVLTLNSINDQEPNGATLLTSKTDFANEEAVEKATESIFEHTGSLISQEKLANMASLLADIVPSASMSKIENASVIPQSSQPINLMDLLTGDDWRNPHLPVEEVENKGNFSDHPHVHPGILINPTKELGNKDGISSGKIEETLGVIEKMPTHEANLTRFSHSQNNQSSLQHEILDHKKKALALKREGRLAEAREELKQAKLLEKSLQVDKPQSAVSSVDISISTTNNTPNAQEVPKTATQAPKPLTSRDRFKLQQESLGHKRQALKLRREGRMDEAEAEFELAKAIETRLEESENHGSSNSSKPINETEGMNNLEVEDLLDPQLLSALKAIGLQDVAIAPPTSENSEGAITNIGNSKTSSSEERKQLEERIKAEKVKALNLKRAGKQAEALDALRRSKLFEKKLNQLAS